MNRISNRTMLATIIALLMFVSFAAGNVTGYLARPALAQDTPPGQFAIFWETWDLVEEFFVDQDKIDPETMTYGAIQGMLDSLGDENHTVFFPPDVHPDSSMLVYMNRQALTQHLVDQVVKSERHAVRN